jgi:sulfur carrier protein/molybdopterin synthase sulfur carrier subunit
MRVKVKLLSVFAEHDRADADGLTAVRDGATVRDLAETLGLPIDLVRIITVNGRQADLDARLSEADLVYLFPPALGGG